MKKIETEILFRPSGLGQIMTNAQGKSSKLKYQEKVDLLAKIEAEIAACSETAKVKKAKAIERAEKIEAEIAVLELVKDDVLLSKTCRKYLKTMMIEIRYKRTKRLENKYVKKGLAVEDVAIEMLSELKGEFFEKNTVRKKNKFFDGECDIRVKNSSGKIKKITDVKCSYDIDSFEDNRDEEMKSENNDQLQGYCDLWDSEIGEIANILVNNDLGLINDLIRFESFKTKPDDLENFNVPNFKLIEIIKDNVFDKKTFVEFLGEHMDANELTCLLDGVSEDVKSQEVFSSFIEIDIEDRCIIISCERDDDRLSEIKQRIAECRAYMGKVYNIHHVC